MKILIVHNRYRSASPGGEDRVVDQEHAALEQGGHEVRRLERSNDEIAGFSPLQKALLPAGVVWSPRGCRDLEGAIRAFRPDVVHLHNVLPLFSPAVVRSCAGQRVPCVVTLHNYQQGCVRGDLYRDGAPCRACVGRTVPLPAVRHGCYHGSPMATVPLVVSAAAHRRTWRTVPAAYLFLSEAQRRVLEPLGFPAWRCFVKPNLAPMGPARRRPENLVVYLGRLTEAKGIRVLMRAWDRFASSGRPALRLVVAGAGPLSSDVTAWAAAHPSVEVLGLLGRDECAGLVRRAAALIAPSEWPEPFGLVVAEAMAAGVAPVATAHGAFPELIEDGVDGLLYPLGDDAALAAVLHRLAGSPQLVADLGDRARRTYERRFTPQAIVRRLETVYEFALANPTWDMAGSRIPQPEALSGRRS